jgi:hypothetical protein
MSLILGLAALTLGHCLPTLPTAPKHTADVPRPPAVTTPLNTFDDNAPDEQTITALAASVYVARAAYRAALAMPDPAATLADIVAALPDVLPQVLGIVKIAPELAEVLHTAITDRMQAYTVVERARTTWHPDYLYALDILADGLNKGGDPASVRGDVHRIADQLAHMQAGQ